MSSYEKKSLKALVNPLESLPHRSVSDETSASQYKSLEMKVSPKKSNVRESPPDYEEVPYFSKKIVFGEKDIEV